MNREIHVRFWESLGVRFPWATHCMICLTPVESKRMDVFIFFAGVRN